MFSTRSFLAISTWPGASPAKARRINKLQNSLLMTRTTYLSLEGVPLPNFPQNPQCQLEQKYQNGDGKYQQDTAHTTVRSSFVAVFHSLSRGITTASVPSQHVSYFNPLNRAGISFSMILAIWTYTSRITASACSLARKTMQFHNARAFALITMIASVAMGSRSRAAPRAALRIMRERSFSSYFWRLSMKAELARKS